MSCIVACIFAVAAIGEDRSVASFIESYGRGSAQGIAKLRRGRWKIEWSLNGRKLVTEHLDMPGGWSRSGLWSDGGSRIRIGNCDYTALVIIDPGSKPELSEFERTSLHGELREERANPFDTWCVGPYNNFNVWLPTSLPMLARRGDQAPPDEAAQMVVADALLDDGRRGVRLVVSFPRKAPPFRIEYVFAPDRHFALASLLTFSDNQRDEECAIEYPRDRPDAVEPIAMKYRSAPPGASAYEFKVLERDPAPVLRGDEFTLARYGLADPPATTPPRRSNWIHLAAAAACALAALAIWANRFRPS